MPQNQLIEKVQTIADILNDTRVISHTDIITLELQESLKGIKKALLSELFETSNKYPSPLWSVEKKCVECQQTMIVTVSKTNMLQYLKKSQYTCSSCQHSLNELQQQKQAILYMRQQHELHIYYRKRLGIFSGEHKYKKNVKARTKVLELIDCINYFGIEFIQDYANNIFDTYQEYLQSEWWRITARHAKYKSNNQCSLCASTENLCTHHKTYDHIYCELKYLDDLIVLCNNCHSKFHAIGA